MLYRMKRDTVRPHGPQIESTGARVVATACANCHLQLSDLNDHYQLEVECVSVTELIAKAMGA